MRFAPVPLATIFGFALLMATLPAKALPATQNQAAQDQAAQSRDSQTVEFTQDIQEALRERLRDLLPASEIQEIEGVWFGGTASLDTGDFSAKLQHLRIRYRDLRRESLGGVSANVGPTAQKVGEAATVEVQTADLEALRWEMLEVAQGWREARPRDVAPFFTLFELAPDERSAAAVLAEAADLFRDDLSALSGLAKDLEVHGRYPQAVELLEGYRQRHPREAEVYRALQRIHERASRKAAVRRTVELWAEALPEDEGPLLFHLQKHILPKVELQAIGRRLLERETPTTEPSVLCGYLGSADLPRLAVACLDRLHAAQRLRGEAVRDPWTSGLARQLAAAGELERFAATVAAPEDLDAQDMRNLISALEQFEESGRCRAVERLLPPLDGALARDERFDWNQRRRAADLAFACGGEETARQALLDMLRTEESSRLIGLVARSLLRLEPEQIEAALRDRLPAAPSDPELHQALNNVYAQTGQVEAMIAHLYEWAEMDPESAAPLTKLARLLAQRGRAEEALAAAREANRRGVEPTSRRQLFDALLTLGKVEEARQLAAEALAAAGERASDDRSAALELLGHSAAAEGNPEEAAELFRRAMWTDAGLQPWKDRPYLEALRDSGRIEELRAHLDTRFQTESHNTTLEAYLGSQLLVLDLPQVAIPHLERAVDLDPLDADSLEKLAKAHRTLGDSSRAEAAYRRAVEIDPSHQPALSALTYLLQGREAYGEVTALLEAREGVDRLAKNLRIALAHAYRRLERLPEAAQILEEVVHRHPTDYQAHIQLGVVYQELELKDEARRAFEDFLTHTAWFETRISECNCGCGVPAQRAMVAAELETLGE